MKIPAGYILAQHETRIDPRTGEPVIMAFSPGVWKRLSPITEHGKEKILKQGWRQIDPKSLITPEAAKEAEAAKEESSEDKLSRLASRSSKKGG